MKVTRLASLAALVAVAGACHTAVPTEPAADVVARPAFDETLTMNPLFDGGMYGSWTIHSDDSEESSVTGSGTDDAGSPATEDLAEATSGDSKPESGSESRGGSMFGSGN
jgi:hypothetical protein